MAIKNWKKVLPFNFEMLFICLAVGFPYTAIANNDIAIYPAVKTAEASQLFKAEVKGHPIFVEKFKDIHYLRFGHTNKVVISIAIAEPVKEWDISGLDSIKKKSLKGNILTVQLEKPGYHVVTINKVHRLFILTDPITAVPLLQQPEVVSIMKYDADSTGVNLSTEAIQKALDETALQKKVLYFPPGIYKTGTITVKSNSRVYLAAGALLLGSEHREHYPSDPGWKESDHVNDKKNFTINGESMTFSRLILIDNASNVRIWGSGSIDGSGSIIRAQGKPANLIRIRNSNNIEIEGLTLRDPACWNLHILYAEKVVIRNIKILNDRTVANTDGFDPDASRDVLIDHCFAYCGDDNVAIKTTNNGGLLRGCENITISNSIFLTKKSAMKIGTETKAPFIRNITFKNNVVLEADRGMVLYCYDGALFENIHFINNYFKDAYPDNERKAIHFKISNRGGKGQIKNVDIINCKIASTFHSRSQITGLDATSQIDGIKIRHLQIDGKVCSSAGEMGLRTNEFVKNITFEN